MTLRQKDYFVKHCMEIDRDLQQAEWWDDASMVLLELAVGFAEHKDSFDEAEMCVMLELDSVKFIRHHWIIDKLRITAQSSAVYSYIISSCTEQYARALDEFAAALHRICDMMNGASL